MSISEKLTAVAENTTRLYNAGKDAEWNAFWDRFQDYGNRRSYNFAFINGGNNWDITNFKPKYDIIMEGNASNAFYVWQTLSTTVDIGAILKAQGVTIDTSKATNAQNLFAYGTRIVGSLPTIDLSSAGGNTGGIFNSVKVTTIDKLIVTEATTYGNMFRDCTNLVNIIFEGTIAQSGLDLSACKSLSGASLESVVRSLSTTTSGLTVTFPNTADATYSEYLEQDTAWVDLIAQRSNWDIKYA
jgi:hypothetical protein